MYSQEISTHFFKFAQTDGVTVRLREVKAKDFNYRVEGDDEFIQYYYSNLNDENSSAVFVAEPINSFIPGWVIEEGRINVIQDIKNLKKPITIDDMGVIRDKNDESRRERDHRGESKTNGDFLIKKYEGLVKAAEKYEFAFTCKNKDLLNILKHYAKKSYVSICYYDKTSVEINGEKLQIIDNKFGAKFTDTSKLRTAYQDYCTYLNDYISHFVSNIPQSHILGITYFTNGLITIEDITAIKDGCTYQLIVAPIMGADQLSNYHDELKRLSKSRKIISIGKSDIPKTAEKPQQKEEVKEMTAKKTNTFGDIDSVKKEVERIYSQIGALEKEKAKWDKMGDKRRVKYYDDLIKDNEHKIKTFQKVISDVEKMEKKTKKTPSKKDSTTKKTSGTTRTKGLHQTGTQTLEGRKMDLKIKAELPGKRTSATGKTYYEYRVNRTDMPTEREEFEKNFHRFYARDDPKLSSISDIKKEIKTQKHSLEFYKDRSAHCKRFDAKDEAKKFDKWIVQTKERIDVLEKELKERKERKTAKKKTSGTASASKSSAKKKTSEKPEDKKNIKDAENAVLTEEHKDDPNIPDEFTLTKTEWGYRLSNFLSRLDGKDRILTEISDKTKSGAIAKYNYLMYVKEQIKYLPKLFGTTNQIRYAENLRKKDMQNFIYRLRDSVLSGNSSLEIDGNKLMQKDFLKATEYVLDIQESKFWIENDYRLRSNLFKIIKSTNMFFDIKNGNISPKGLELPGLKGSEKQINWAKSIRNSFIYGAFLKLSDFNFSPSPNLDDRIDGVIKINKKLFGNSEAKFWIDNRDYFYYDLAEKVAQQIIQKND